MYVKDGRTLTVLQHKYGLAGIGFFTNLMRILSDTPDHYLNLSSEADRLYMSSKIGCDEDEMEAYIETMITTGKLDETLWGVHSVVYCSDLVDSLESLYEKRKTRPMTIDQIVVAVSDPDTPHCIALPESETPVTAPETPQRIVKDSKGEERKSAKPPHPTLDIPMNQTRYDTLCEQYGKGKVDETMQSVKDWAASKGKRILDYAAAAANWMKKDNVEPLTTPEVDMDMHPPTCECGGKVSALNGEAMCRGCQRWWNLKDGKWEEAGLAPTKGAGHTKE